MIYRTLNPATEKLVSTYRSLPWKKAEQCLSLAHRAFVGWRGTPLAEKGGLMRRMASILRERKSSCSLLITQEMGKPVSQAEAEIEKCASGCEFYADRSQEFLREERITTDAGKSYVRFDPLGVILGVMPWNFPFWQVFRFAVPAIMAGNAVVLKPAPNAPACGLTIESIFKDALSRRSLFQTLLLSNQDAGRAIASPYVQGVSLTGSDRAGREVAALAGRHLKKTVLELGGSDPFIVLEDADIERAVSIAVRSRMLNTGQSCIAAKRLIVHRKIYRKFEEALVEAVKRLKVGDPLERTTEVGPLARKDLLLNLERQVKTAVKEGARVLCGATRIEGRGFYYSPTVLARIGPDMIAFKEEVFGPVACLVSVGNEEEAIELANRTSYGLGASLWTRDLGLAEILAAQIEAGSVFINGMVRSDPRLPFGGIKRSGYGRELSELGLKEFTNAKTVWIE